MPQITNNKVVVRSSNGQYLYGTITYDRDGIVVVMTTHRKRWITIPRRIPYRLMGMWEQVWPVRKMLAIGGSVVEYVKVPEE